MPLHRIDFPVLARGMDREAPMGTLQRDAAEGPLWRELQNLVPHDGVLRRREALVEVAGSAPTFLDNVAQSPVGLFEVASTSSAVRWLLVTAREMYAAPGFGASFGTWVNLTPRYEIGTLSVTSGTNIVIGTSTEWQTRSINAGQPIQLPRGSGSWYVIDQIVSDTALLLTTNYTGTSLSGANYSIRRTFGMAAGGVDKVFAVSLNGDVYVAGILAHGDSLGAIVPDGAILKIAEGANLAATLTAAGSVSYLTTGISDVAFGIDRLGDLISQVNGLVVLADGRLVILAQWVNSILATDGANNRLYYSSHLNLAVWTTSPGGFTDIVGHNGRGTALTGGARGVYVHFSDGIEIGDLTGAQDPPLRLRPSQATLGAVGPKMVATIPGGRAIPPGDLFVGADGGIYLFNGGDATPIEWVASKADLGKIDKDELFNDGFTRVDTFRKYVSFFIGRRPNSEAVVASGAYELRVYYEQQVYVICRYQNTILTAAATPLSGGGPVTRNEAPGYLCTPRFDNAAAESGVIYGLSETDTADETPDFTGGATSSTCRAETDVFTDALRVWAVSHVELSASRPVDALKVPVLRVLRDGVEEAVSGVLPLGGSSDRVIRYYPGASSGREVAVRLSSGQTADAGLADYALKRMVVFVVDVGEARTA